MNLTSKQKYVLALACFSLVLVSMVSHNLSRGKFPTYYQWRSRDAGIAAVEELQQWDYSDADFEHSDPNELMYTFEFREMELWLLEREANEELRSWKPSFEFGPSRRVRPQDIRADVLRAKMREYERERGVLEEVAEVVREAVVEVPSSRAAPQASVRRGLFS
jgi:hypothetical protein